MIKSGLRHALQRLSARAPNLYRRLVNLTMGVPAVQLRLVTAADPKLTLNGTLAAGVLRGCRFDNLLVDELLPVLQNGMERISSELVTQLDLRGETVLDIGASYGYYAVLLSRCVGESGTVYAFEPDLPSLMRLVHNLEINRCRNVLTLPYAVAQVTAFALWETGGERPWNGRLATGNAQAAVPIVTIGLDELVTHLNAPSIALVKIDVEGAEADILEASPRLLNDMRPMALVELHSAEIARRVLDTFNRSRYSVYTIEYMNDRRHHIWAIPDELADRYRSLSARFTRSESA